ncbi:MAG TPA: hypothetical protein ENJ09_09260 [Planctomycetes bacterium]|nr:hypothetical protein [Planctomycetota bacterium]
MTPLKSLLLGSALLLAPVSANADSITKTDGTVLSGVTVVNEGLDAVTYKEGRASKSVPAGEVASVEFDAYPEDVDEALGYLAEGDAVTALQVLEGYVDAQVRKSSERRYKWAPAFAAHMTIVLHQRLFDLQGMKSAADRLIENYPKSRYLPEAYLALARAEAWLGDSGAAMATLDRLAELVASEGLSEHWSREVALEKVALDPEQTGPAKRAALADVAKAASGDPVVWAQARVAEGESYLTEAEAAPAPKAKDLREKARRVFEDVIAKDGAGEEALAGAYAGLGDCMFFEGADADDEAILKQAVTSYLRVVLSYPNQGQYVPKALFYAMRCFDLMGDRSRTRDMRRALLSLYGGTSWAERPEVKN